MNTEQQKITHLAIDIDTANNILAYLSAKPYRETASLINALNSSKPVNLVDEPKDTPSVA